MKTFVITLISLLMVFGSLLAAGGLSVQAQAEIPDPEKITALGKALFFDPNLSVNGKQSCASCHAPNTGFTGPDSTTNLTTSIYEGAIAARYGNRKPPPSNYIGASPALYFNEDLSLWMGGMFWDGRATGWVLGDPVAEQAQGPFLNPLEMAMPDARLVVVRVAKSDYAGLFKEVWGRDALKFATAQDVAGAYERIAHSIAAYERSAEANPYSSKFDRFYDRAKAKGLDVRRIRCGTQGGGMEGGMGGGMGGMCSRFDANGSTSPDSWFAYRGLGLDNMELQGLAVFNDPARANCASCHSLAEGEQGYPLFTDFSYHNLGVPKNPDNPFYAMPQVWNPDGAGWVDPGLGGFLESAGYPAEVYSLEYGKFKVPSLRNVDQRPSDGFVKSYGHNGYFKTLQDVIIFYSWRGLVMNGGLGMGGSGTDGCSDGGEMGGGGMGGGMTPEMMMMCSPDLFPAPEVAENLTPMNHFNMMSDTMRIESFLKTLTDIN